MQELDSRFYIYISLSLSVLQQKYLMRYGYLPQVDLEKPYLRSQDQLRHAIKTLQVSAAAGRWRGGGRPRSHERSYTHCKKYCENNLQNVVL